MSGCYNFVEPIIVGESKIEFLKFVDLESPVVMPAPRTVAFHNLSGLYGFYPEPQLRVQQQKQSASNHGNVNQLLKHSVNLPMISLYGEVPHISQKGKRSATYSPIALLPEPIDGFVASDGNTSPCGFESRELPSSFTKMQSRKRKVIEKRTDFDKGSRSRSETGYRGVRFSTNGCRFRATVNVNKTPFNVGTFDTAQCAAEEYDKALIYISKGKAERSRLNFPMAWQKLYEEVREAATKGEKLSYLHPPKRRKVSHSKITLQ